MMDEDVRDLARLILLAEYPARDGGTRWRIDVAYPAARAWAWWWKPNPEKNWRIGLIEQTEALVRERIEQVDGEVYWWIGPTDLCYGICFKGWTYVIVGDRFIDDELIEAMERIADENGCDEFDLKSVTTFEGTVMPGTEFRFYWS
jgi:hypothetical protein